MATLCDLCGLNVFYFLSDSTRNNGKIEVEGGTIEMRPKKGRKVVGRSGNNPAFLFNSSIRVPNRTMDTLP